MRCSHCRTDNADDRRACSACGSSLGGERRQLTVLFCDLVGSTALSRQLDPEDLRPILRAYQEAAGTVITRHEGHVAQYLGDGLLAYFGHPKPHEDDAARAVRAGLEIVKAVRELTLPLTGPGRRLEVRVGIHTGLVVLGEIGGEGRHEHLALGETPNIAARLQALAEPDTVVISDATGRVVEGLFDAEALGPRELKGVAEPVGGYRVVAARSAASRFEVSRRRGLTPLVGRRREFESLRQSWEAAGSEVRVVNVIGEPGIGKSRLVHEFAATLSSDDALFLSGHCTSEGRTTPFLPFIEVVRTLLHAGEGDAATEDKVRRGLELLGVPGEETVSYLSHLLGRAPASLRAVDAEILGLRTRQALQAVLEARCRLSPTVLNVEDLHWVDTASEEFLGWVTQPGRPLPLLVVCTFRPGYRPPWQGRENATDVHVEPLSRTSILDLVRSRLGMAELEPRVEAVVAEKAEGNPLFAEEIATYFQQAAAAHRGPTPAEDMDLPVTLENLLMDRIGRLPDGPRALLETAAVIGRRFPLDLLRGVSRLNGAVGEWLHDLERHDLVFREPEGAVFAFKHALVRDAVYHNLLRARREELHDRVASALVVAHSERLEEIAETLADHYTRTRHADKAVRYLALAGAKSLALYALDEAEVRFRQALDLIAAAPGCADDALLADILLNLARVSYFRADMKGIIALVEPYLPRVEALGDRRRLSRFLFETGYAHVFAARQDVGKPLLERALALGEEIGDDQSIGYACMGLLWHHTFWAPAGPERHATVERLGRRALEVGRRTGDVWLMSKTLLCLGTEATTWGHGTEAVRIYRQLLQLSEDTGDPRPKGMALFGLAFAKAYEGEYDAALEYAESAIRSSVSPIDRLFGRLARATALAFRGGAQESLERFDELRRRCEAGEFRMVGLVSAEIPYGLALIAAGRLAEGVRAIERATQQYTDWGNPWARAFRHWILGRVYLQVAHGGRRPPLGVVLRNLGFLARTVPFARRLARRHLEAAVQEARRLPNPSALGDALFHLGSLHASAGRTGEARACFEEARAVAASIEASALAERIDAAAAALAS
jgi:class 3 adenylate cyclase/tetratricopeptide (TPR) repeat protein